MASMCRTMRRKIATEHDPKGDRLTLGNAIDENRLIDKERREENAKRLRETNTACILAGKLPLTNQ